MATDMDTAMVIKKANYRFHRLAFFGLFLPLCSIAADVKLQSSVSQTTNYTDNVQLTETQQKSSTILGATVSTNLKVQEGLSDLNLRYKATQYHYCGGERESKFTQSLALSGQKRFSNTGWNSSLRATVRNVPRSAAKNASDDELVGDTVESRALNLGLNYSNQSRGPTAIVFSASAGQQDSEDGVGDSTSLNVGLQLGSGRLVQGYFWDLNSSFRQNQSRVTNRKNNSQTMNYQIGFELFEDLSPTLTTYAEKYSQSGGGAVDREQLFARVGPGLRYELSERSYIQASYNHVVNGTQKDSLGLQAVWQPSRRTKLTFNYATRYFGKSYDFNLSHKNKRWTNIIRYTESADSFNREYNVDDENIEDLALARTLNWTSSYSLRRSNLSFSAYTRQRQSGLVEESGASRSNDTYGCSINYLRTLNSDTRLNLALKYSEYSFEQSSEQTDKYFTFNAKMSHRFLNKLNVSYGANISNRNSSLEGSSYDENRLFLNLSKQF